MLEFEKYEKLLKLSLDDWEEVQEYSKQFKW